MRAQAPQGLYGLKQSVRNRSIAESLRAQLRDLMHLSVNSRPDLATAIT